MKINMEELKEIAEIAHLELTVTEKEKHLRQINTFLAQIESLKQVDVNELEPLDYVQPLKNVLRKDQLGPSLSQSQVLLNVRDHEQGMFKVPKIL